MSTTRSISTAAGARPGAWPGSPIWWSSATTGSPRRGGAGTGKSRCCRPRSIPRPIGSSRCPSGPSSAGSGRPAICAIWKRSLRRWLQVARRFPGVSIAVCCEEPPDLPGLPVRYVPWSPAAEADFLASITLGVMPLDDGPWERGKCSFKMLQYLAAGRPCVVSPVGMNREVLAQAEVGLAATSCGRMGRGTLGHPRRPRRRAAVRDCGPGVGRAALQPRGAGAAAGRPDPPPRGRARDPPPRRVRSCSACYLQVHIRHSRFAAPPRHPTDGAATERRVGRKNGNLIVAPFRNSRVGGKAAEAGQNPNQREIRQILLSLPGAGRDPLLRRSEISISGNVVPTIIHSCRGRVGPAFERVKKSAGSDTRGCIDAMRASRRAQRRSSA